MIPFIESDVGVAVGISVGIPAVPTTIAASIGNWIAVFGITTLTHKVRAKVNKINNQNIQQTLPKGNEGSREVRRTWSFHARTAPY